MGLGLWRDGLDGIVIDMVDYIGTKMRRLAFVYLWLLGLYVSILL